MCYYGCVGHHWVVGVGGRFLQVCILLLPQYNSFEAIYDDDASL